MCAGTLQDNPKCTALVSKPTDKCTLWIRWSSSLPRISCEGSSMIIPPTVKKFPAFIWCKTSPSLSQKLPIKPLRNQPNPLHNPLSYCLTINFDAMAYQSWKPCGLTSCLYARVPCFGFPQTYTPSENFRMLIRPCQSTVGIFQIRS